MVGYRRNFVPGGTYFFTVTLADRNSKILVDRIDLLRGAFRVTRRERPFVIDAIVILPDHLHAIFSLPPGDSDFPGRWRRIKGHFSSALIESSTELKRRPNGNLALCKDVSGSIPSGTRAILHGTLITFISIRSSMALCSGCGIGRTRRFIAM